MLRIAQRSLVLLVLSVASASLVGCCATPPADSNAVGVSAVELNDLMTTKLQGLADREVIVSKVSVPPHTQLPRHWHPGEEFAYMLEGSVTLWQQGKPDSIARQGDLVAIPLKQVHTIHTADEGAVILVFRVHKAGQPQRVLVD